jgi:hypothetical protein
LPDFRRETSNTVSRVELDQSLKLVRVPGAVACVGEVAAGNRA